MDTANNQTNKSRSGFCHRVDTAGLLKEAEGTPPVSQQVQSLCSVCPGETLHHSLLLLMLLLMLLLVVVLRFNDKISSFLPNYLIIEYLFFYIVMLFCMLSLVCFNILPFQHEI